MADLIPFSDDESFGVVVVFDTQFIVCLSVRPFHSSSSLVSFQIDHLYTYFIELLRIVN